MTATACEVEDTKTAPTIIAQQEDAQNVIQLHKTLQVGF